MPQHPEPPVQLRRLLEVSRRQHLTFDEAWEAAFRPGRIRWPHDTTHRRQWKAIIAAQREVWEGAYFAEAEIPGGRALVLLADALRDPPPEPAGTIATVGHMTPEATREVAAAA
jgi:hypothetical protein